jgi:hypothetical protein
MTQNERKLFNKVINELHSFVFSTTNLVDDLSTNETEKEKERVEDALILLLRTINETA